MIWPVMGWISSPFGEREGRLHKGLDLAANMGYPILAVQKGVVTYADEMGTYGLMVTVDHGNGLETVYAHAASLLVQKGESVEQGQVIALVGSTGRSTGPHLHLEVRVNGKQVNPLLFLANTKV